MQAISGGTTTTMFYSPFLSFPFFLLVAFKLLPTLLLGALSPALQWLVHDILGLRLLPSSLGHTGHTIKMYKFAYNLVVL
jgi:hypothetical protein